MAERERRIGENESIFRQVNEQIEGVNTGLADVADGKMHIVCECGDLHCAVTIPVALEVYERVRADSTLFIVKSGHIVEDLEDVVAGGAAYQIVRKRPGGPAEVARATDPRRPEGGE
jgi:hypothetical protein